MALQLSDGADNCGHVVMGVLLAEVALDRQMNQIEIRVKERERWSYQVRHRYLPNHVSVSSSSS
jgi:hypothetical protein